jgi:hypothetical protein
MWPEEHEVGTKHMRIGEDLRLLRHFVPRNDKGGEPRNDKGEPRNDSP